MEERIGQQLGNYRLIRLLGQGGFADVYLGEHMHLGTQAALKVLQVRLLGEHLELFRNEAPTEPNPSRPNQDSWHALYPTSIRPTIQKQDVESFSAPIPSIGNTSTTTPDTIGGTRPPSGQQTPLPGASSTPMVTPSGQVREDVTDTGMPVNHLSQPIHGTPLPPAAFPPSMGTSPSSDGHRISRRVVVASLLGVAGIGISALAIDWARSAGLVGTHGSSTPTSTPTGIIRDTSTPSLPARGTILVRYPGTGNIWTAGWSPDGKYIASSGENPKVHVWDVKTGKDVYTYSRHAGQFASVASLVWSPDGTRIASGGLDNLVLVWEAR